MVLLLSESLVPQILEMPQTQEERRRFLEYRRTVEESIKETVRQRNARRAKQHDSPQSTASPHDPSRTVLVDRVRAARRCARRSSCAAVYERSGSPKLGPSPILCMKASDFFSAWLAQNPKLTPSEETWQRCLCEATAVANANRMYLASEFVEDVRFYYTRWARELELETYWNRCQQ